MDSDWRCRRAGGSCVGVRLRSPPITRWMPSAEQAAHPFLAQYVQSFTIICGLLGIFIRWLVVKRKTPPKPFELDTIITAFMAAASIPVGVLLVGSAFDRHMFAFLSDLYIALAAAGIATIYLAIKGLTS
jgi:hypothetical protein